MFSGQDSPPTNDDLVLYCAMYLQERQSQGSQLGLAKVFLLTDDVNLRVRAHAEELGALSFDEAPCTSQQVANQSMVSISWCAQSRSCKAWPQGARVHLPCTAGDHSAGAWSCCPVHLVEVLT